MQCRHGLLVPHCACLPFRAVRVLGGPRIPQQSRLSPCWAALRRFRHDYRRLGTRYFTDNCADQVRKGTPLTGKDLHRHLTLDSMDTQRTHTRRKRYWHMGGREGRPGCLWEQSGQTRELFTPDCSLHRLEHTRKCALGRGIRRRNGRNRNATDATRTKTERRNTHPGPALEIRRTQTTRQNLFGRRARGHRGTERELEPGHQRTPLDLQTPLGGSGFP